jgi:hypothetical protein
VAALETSNETKNRRKKKSASKQKKEEGDGLVFTPSSLKEFNGEEKLERGQMFSL